MLYLFVLIIVIKIIWAFVSSDKTSLPVRQDANLLENNFKTDLTPEQTIRRCVDYMPDFYRTDLHFKDCVDFLEHNEWGLALDSLIKVASASEHYFSEEFWFVLANAADEMGMVEKAKYCRQQISRNAKDIQFKTPFGWTTVKFDDTHYQHYISEKLKEEWATERRGKDKVVELMNHEGVHLKWNGRSGFIYCVDKGRLAEVDFELGMNGFITYFNSVEHWVLPTKMAMSKEEKEKLKEKLSDWADKTKNELDFN